jgi:hypothetical protein
MSFGHQVGADDDPAADRLALLPAPGQGRLGHGGTCLAQREKEQPSAGADRGLFQGGIHCRGRIRRGHGRVIKTFQYAAGWLLHQAYIPCIASTSQ